MTTTTPTPETRECLRCGHTWEPRVWHPVRCPVCSSPKWNHARRAAQNRKEPPDA